jgi:hypothetical protein
MILNRKIMTLIAIGMLLLSSLTILATNPSARAYTGEATLTGVIYDRGVDADSNGKYDYLEVTIEVNVTEAGDFRVECNSFMNDSGFYLNSYGYNYSYLDIGLRNVTMFFYGPTFNRASFDPKNISQISLFLDYGSPALETIDDVSLSRIYNYTEFDIGAFFTKEVSDSGIDKDGDGLFDILQIGVQINVTDPGEYSVSPYALIDNTDPLNTTYYYEYQSVHENFSADLHTVLFNYSGPGIAMAQINVTTIESVSLSSLDSKVTYAQVDQLYNVPLSKTYNYTMFDAPSKDTELNFTVNPDGSVGVGILANFTHVYPPFNGPLVNSTLSISRIGNLTTGLANCVFSLPSDVEDFYNSIDGHVRTVYQNGILNSTMSGTMFLPPQAQTTYPFNSTDLMFDAAYANGVLNAHLSGETIVPMFESTFPFNASDLTVFADYDGAALKGNVTFHVVSGFPSTDIRADFLGDRTNVSFTGNVNVTYGTFGDLQLNSTVLDQLIANLTGQITGQGPNSLYNMTYGTLEVTEVNTTKTAWADPEMGADVMYAVTVNGNFTGFLGKLIADQMKYQYSDTERSSQIAYAALESMLNSLNEAHLILNYYHNTGTGSIVTLDMTCDAKAFWNNALMLVPPVLPPETATQLSAILKIANATAYAVQDFSVDASLSSSELKIAVTTSILVNQTQLKADTLPFMADLGPPEMHDMFESFLNTPYAVLESATAACDVTNGTGTLSADWTVRGDMTTDLNRGIQLYFDTVNVTSLGTALPPQLLLLNETDTDINNLRAQIDLGKDTLFINITGLILRPLIDPEDLIRFRLNHWFDRLHEVYESLQATQNLKVDIIGGFDSTHIILLNPSSLPSGPDSYSLNYTSMAWQNTTFSSMSNLQFLIAYDGKINYAGNMYHIPIFTNSTVTNVTFLNSVNTLSFEVSGENGTGFCNVTIPRNFINATLGQWRVKLDGAYLTQENYTVSENAEYVFLYLNYAHSIHTIEIEGIWSVAELQPNLLPLILAAIGLVAALITIRHRKKLTPLKTKCESSIRTFIDTLHR